MKSTKKKIEIYVKQYCLFIIIIMVLCLLGCNSSKRLDYNLVYYEEDEFGVSDEGHRYPDKVIASYSQLIEDCDEYNNGAFDKNSFRYSSLKSQEIRKHDENYFKNNDLLIISFVTGMREEVKIKNIKFDGEKLEVNLRERTPLSFDSISTLEPSYRMMIVEIEKLNTVKDNITVVINLL